MHFYQKERIFLKSCGISGRKIRKVIKITPARQAALRDFYVLGPAKPPLRMRADRWSPGGLRYGNTRRTP
jgi:hypothetical protein